MPNSLFPFRRRTWRQQAAATGVMVVLLAGIFAFLYPHDHGAAFGALAGGGVVVLVSAFALLRTRHGSAQHGFERMMGGAADERDKQLLLTTFAMAGWTALIAMTGNIIALVLHANPMTAAAVAMCAVVVAMAVTYVVMSRRM